MRQPVGAEIDGKSAGVGRADRGQVLGRCGLVSAGKPVLAGVRLDQLRQCARVNCVAIAWQIARLVVTPKLPCRQRCDLCQEGVVITAGLANGTRAPKQR